MIKSDYLFERLEGTLSRLSVWSISEFCLIELRRWEHDRIEAMTRGVVPHEQLLLLRLAAVHCSTSGSGRAARTKDWRQLTHLIKRISDSDRGLVHGDGHAMLRAVRHQQLWTQRDILPADLGRLWLLFGSESADLINARHREAFGYSLREHILFSFFVWVLNRDRPSYLSLTSTSIFGNTRIPTSVQGAFLERMATSRGRLVRLSLTRPGAVRNRLLQVYERSPFVELPLLRRGGLGYYYVPVSQGVLAEHIRGEPFRVCRELGLADKLVGGLFESHVEMVLRQGFGPAVRRGDSSRAGGKAPDFLISLDGQTELIVESKASSFGGVAALSRHPRAFANGLKSSVVKGLVQILTRGQHLARAGRQGFGLIVTPWRFELGAVQTFWEFGVGEKVLRSLKLDDVSQLAIPLERIWVVSSGELEDFVSWISEGSESPLMALSRFANADRDPSTRLSSFSMHFPQLPPGQMLPQVERAWDEMTELGVAVLSR